MTVLHSAARYRRSFGFLSDPYYATARSLICHERIRFANVYLRFGIDLRFLLAGAASVEWNEDEEQFVPVESPFEALLSANACIYTYQVEDTQSLYVFLEDKIGFRRDLAFVHQAEIIDTHFLLTEIGIYRPSRARMAYSEIRQGKEGFEFVVDPAELGRRYGCAGRGSVQVIHRENVRKFVDDRNQFRAELLTLHDQSLSHDPFETEAAFREHLQQTSCKLGELPIDANMLPTFFALKYCGPICWYFTRIANSVYGLNGAYCCFSVAQVAVADRIYEKAMHCRTLGLRAGSAPARLNTSLDLDRALSNLVSEVHSLPVLRVTPHA